MCTEFISRHINQLAPTEIFTTREVLMYGSRSAVDSTLGRMVASGHIHRLARGVFVKDLSGNPTLSQIVQAKLKGFGGKIAIHAMTILSSFHLASGDFENTFAKNGSSSSFDTIRGRAFLKNHCARKMRLYQIEASRASIALWKHGEDWIDGAVNAITESFNRIDRETFALSAVLRPAWLNRACRHRYPAISLCVENPFFASEQFIFKTDSGHKNMKHVFKKMQV